MEVDKNEARERGEGEGEGKGKEDEGSILPIEVTNASRDSVRPSLC